MKKGIVIALIAAMAATFVLGGCSSKESELSSTNSASSSASEDTVYDTAYLMDVTDYNIDDYVTLGDYSDITVDVDSSYEVTDEAIKTNAEYLLAANPYNKEVDKAAKDGYVVNIDYVGKIDGEEFDGGSSEDYDLTLGSDTMIDGFEDGLIGHKAGDEVTLDLTFPDDYSNEDLQGKDVEFTVTVNKVMKSVTVDYDDMTDEEIEAMFGDTYGITTVDDFKSTIESSLENQLNQQKQNAFISKLVEISEVEIPNVEVEDGDSTKEVSLVEKRVDEAMDNLEATAEDNDMTLDEYCQNNLGADDADAYEETLTTQYEESIPQELVLEKLVEDLNCEVSSSDFQSFVDYYVSYYSTDEDTFYEQVGGKDVLILNYAEYYVALPEATENVKINYVDSSAEEDSTDDSSASAEE